MRVHLVPASGARRITRWAIKVTLVERRVILPPRRKLASGSSSRRLVLPLRTGSEETFCRASVKYLGRTRVRFRRGAIGVCDLSEEPSSPPLPPLPPPPCVCLRSLFGGRKCSFLSFLPFSSIFRVPPPVPRPREERFGRRSEFVSGGRSVGRFFLLLYFYGIAFRARVLPLFSILWLYFNYR